MKTIGRNVTVFDVYDRAKHGPKMEEKKWISRSFQKRQEL